MKFRFVDWEVVPAPDTPADSPVHRLATGGTRFGQVHHQVRFLDLPDPQDIRGFPDFGFLGCHPVGNPALGPNRNPFRLGGHEDW